LPVLDVARNTDAAVARTRPLWLWLGQAALIVLGTHLACDSLDDHVLTLLQALPLAWDSPDSAALPAAWVAVVLELTVAAWAAAQLWTSMAFPPVSWKVWSKRPAVRDIVRPVFWTTVALAGCWVIAMSVEDVVAPLNGWLGLGLGWAIGAVAAWRLGWTGLRSVLGGPRPRSRLAGVTIAPLLLGVAALAVGELPIWGAWW
jgi:hypothetical protein